MEAIQAQIVAIAARIDAIELQVQANTAGHQEVHPVVRVHEGKLGELDQRLRDLEARSSNCASPTSTSEDMWRRRLDRLAECKEN
eukprot:4058768-Karenia_brevis.AAC.1